MKLGLVQFAKLITSEFVPLGGFAMSDEIIHSVLNAVFDVYWD